MNIQQKFVFALIGLIFLLIHSFKIKGRRATLTFFVFAFIAALTKEVSSFIDPVTSAIVPPPFLLPEDSIILGALHVSLGWVFAFYLGWVFAEKILRKISSSQIRIFPMVIMTGLIVASFSYPIEATGINVGWWNWSFFEERFVRFLVGDIHFFAMNAWFFFSVHSLLPYYLIECSGFREKPWKNLFIFIPVFRLIVMIYFGSGQPRVMYEYIFLVFLLIMLFIDRVKYTPIYSGVSDSKTKRKSLVASLPFLSTLIVIGVLSFVNLVVIKEPMIMLSLLPVFLLVLLSIEKVPAFIVYLILPFFFVFFGVKAVPAAFPLLILLLIYLSEKIKKRAV